MSPWDVIGWAIVTFGALALILGVLAALGLGWLLLPGRKRKA